MPTSKFKELLTIAKAELKVLTNLKNPDFRLEQAVFKEDRDAWEIVVSFLVENKNQAEIKMSPAYKFERIYKRLIIDEYNEIVGMYIHHG